MFLGMEDVPAILQTSPDEGFWSFPVISDTFCPKYEVKKDRGSYGDRLMTMRKKGSPLGTYEYYSDDGEDYHGFTLCGRCFGLFSGCLGLFSGF
jgi:hypothetical protein